MEKCRDFWASVLASMSASGDVYSHVDYPALQGSDLERIKATVVTVGNEFKQVIQREKYGKASPSSSNR